MKIYKGLFLVCILIILISLAYALQWQTSTQSDFDEGIYEDTYYNTSLGAVVLNSTTNGGYMSKVFDAGSDSRWGNIRWVEGLSYGEELQNMTENELLFHLNNESAFGENDTNVFDFSYNDNNGTWMGNAKAEVDGKFGKAGNFSGTNDDYLKVSDSNSLDIEETLSIEFWVHFNAITTSDSIIYKNQAYRVRLPGSNPDRIQVSFHRGVWKDVNSDDAAITQGKWHHVVCTINVSEPEQVHIYVDGVEVGYKSGILGSGNISISDKDLHIGCNHNEGNCLNGYLDEIVIYNRILSSEEILEHYKMGALKLNPKVRSCDDLNCNGEKFIVVDDNSPQNLTVLDNRYFQYKFDFETDETEYSPELYNVTIDYTILNSAPDTPILNSPQNNSNISVNYTLLNTTVTDPDGNNMTVWFFGDSDLINTIENVVNNSIVIYNWTNLENNLHNWSIIAGNGIANTSSDTLFFTIDTADKTPPTITDITPNDITNGEATITWMTNEVSNSSVNYGEAENLGSVEGSISLVLSHSVTLTSLETLTLYYYNVTSCDAVGNCNTTGLFNFTTINAPPRGGDGGGATPPGPICGDGICDSEAGESWKTCLQDCPPPKVEEEIEYTICDITVSLNQIYIGTCRALEENERIYFVYKETEHYIIVDSISADNVYISIYSLPQYATLLVDETKEFNLDDDGITDIRVNLDELNYEKQEVSITVEIIQRCDCPECSLWSECKEGKQIRTCYKCNEETNFVRVAYEENRDCKKSVFLIGAVILQNLHIDEYNWWMVLRNALVILVAILFVFKTWPKKESESSVKIKKTREEEEEEIFKAARKAIKDMKKIEPAIPLNAEDEKVITEVRKNERKSRDDLLKELRKAYEQ
ncbi:MAG: LamG domain-containing protein [Candidatus Pacearchaeota archaeon]|nr:MAG: LamG domain-containing protein [Candidatus Pacearchaeota archaeon]